MAAIHRRCISYVFTGLDSIAIDGFSDILLCMHNIDEKGRRKDVLLTTAVSEKLMRKGLHTYLLDEIYENSRSVKVKVKIN